MTLVELVEEEVDNAERAAYLCDEVNFLSSRGGKEVRRSEDQAKTQRVVQNQDHTHFLSNLAVSGKRVFSAPAQLGTSSHRSFDIDSMRMISLTTLPGNISIQSCGLSTATTVCIVRVSPITLRAFVTAPRTTSSAAGVREQRCDREAMSIAPASVTSFAPVNVFPSVSLVDPTSSILTHVGRTNAMIPSSILGYRVMYSAKAPVENAMRLRWTPAVGFGRSSAVGRRETMKRARSGDLIMALTMTVRGSGVGDVL